MPGTSRFTEVPVLDVTVKNIKEIWPSLVLSVKTATFVALDTELSGLGDKKLLCARSLIDRYKNLCEVAKSRSIVSLGLSCFKLSNVDQNEANSSSTVSSGEKSIKIKQWTFIVQTFNIVLLCSEDYLVEPSALTFLVDHGFDFNKQYAFGVSYYRGKEQPETDASKLALKVKGPNARQLFDILLWSGVPIVFHNGFVDLIFIYQNLYTDLPASLQMFLGDLADMFPEGILDTKYIVEYIDRLPATYLEYVFRKWQRKNALQSSIDRREVCLEFPHSSIYSTYASYSHCDLPESTVEMDYIPKASVLQELVCHSFAGHGWCSKGRHCPKSHAIDLILDLDGIKTAKNRQRRRKLAAQKGQASDDSSPISLDNTDDISEDMVETSDDQTDSLVEETKSKKGKVFNVSEVCVSGSAEPPRKICKTEDSTIITEKDTIELDSIMNFYLKTSFQLEKGRSGCHRAGFDAFMTGFTMACLLCKLTNIKESVQPRIGTGIKLSELTGIERLKNKMYIAGKDQPLVVTKSSFSSTSKNHKERIERIRK